MIEATPRNPNAHNSLGETLQMQGDLAGAEAAFRSALAIDPADDFALKALASLQ
jgi:Flp pilus assembly protein TadD